MAREVGERFGRPVRVETLYDFQEILTRGIAAVPATSINDVIVCSGRELTEDELTTLLEQTLRGKDGSFS